MRYLVPLTALAMTFFACDRHATTDTQLSASVVSAVSVAPVVSAAPSATGSFSKPPTAARVIAWFIHSKMPFDANASVAYTEENDPNKLLGRPHRYTEKAVWKDPRTKEDGEPALETGGTVEIFANDDDAKTRFDYVEALSSASSLLTEYHYRRGVVLVRLSSKFTPTQAKEYEAALAAMP